MANDYSKPRKTLGELAFAPENRPGAEIQRRMAVLAGQLDVGLNLAEMYALSVLDAAGYESLQGVNAYIGEGKWVLWAAESFVWTARRMRNREKLDALRGILQGAEYLARATEAGETKSPKLIDAYTLLRGEAETLLCSR